MFFLNNFFSNSNFSVLFVAADITRHSAYHTSFHLVELTKNPFESQFFQFSHYNANNFLSIIIFFILTTALERTIVVY